jgi:hypothetical protein|tara:strand:+ start:1288 stop:1809 length:522 start_codon:yes stop_codon:yes gene_type:complete
MKIEFYNDPWKHFTITNLLDIDAFDRVNEFSKNISVTGDRNNIQVRSNNFPEMYNLLVPYIHKIASIAGIDDITNLYPAIEFDVIKPGWAYNKIHNDNPLKVMTFVLAISNTGSGTQLFKEKDTTTYVKTTNWLPNRGSGFIRNDHTWHDFDSLECTENRRTLLLMLSEKEFY